MKYNLIRAGYRVSVTSYDGDGDNLNTEVIDGLSEEEAQFVVKLSKLHKSGKYGNMIAPTIKEEAKYEKAVTKMFKGARDISSDWEITDFNSMQEAIFTLGLCSVGDYYTRVCDSITVEYFSEDVYIDNVTDQFV